jgi:hypothetical protein
MTGISVKTMGAALLLAGLFFGCAAQADTGRASIEGISANQNNAPQIALASRGRGGGGGGTIVAGSGGGASRPRCPGCYSYGYSRYGYGRRY